jgi:Na+-transporting methylmalonyl-CoA/oxaloacetate decarboxylase gamma subunit
LAVEVLLSFSVSLRLVRGLVLLVLLLLIILLWLVAQVAETELVEAVAREVFVQEPDCL